MSNRIIHSLLALGLHNSYLPGLFENYDMGYIPNRPIGNGKDVSWRKSRRAKSLKSRSNRRKAMRLK